MSTLLAVSLDGYAAGPHQALDTPSASVEQSCSNGFSLRVRGSTCMATKTADLRSARWRTSAPGFWDATCSAQCAPGRTLMERMVGRRAAISCAYFCSYTSSPRVVEMKGGTAFHFATDGFHAALQRAKDAAKETDVRIGGGVATIQQYLRARLIDELHLAFRPILMSE